MLINFWLWLLPAWRALSKAQRRFVRDNCVRLILGRGTVIFGKLVLGGSVPLAAIPLGGFETLPRSLAVIALAVVVAPGLVELAALGACWRDLGMFIRDHAPKVKEPLSVS
jgi:hypothetical protein